MNRRRWIARGWIGRLAPGGRYRQQVAVSLALALALVSLTPDASLVAARHGSELAAPPQGIPKVSLPAGVRLSPPVTAVDAPPPTKPRLAPPAGATVTMVPLVHYGAPPPGEAPFLPQVQVQPVAGFSHPVAPSAASQIVSSLHDRGVGDAATATATSSALFCVPTSGQLGSYGYSSTHRALDILSSTGTRDVEPVYVAAPGVIKWIWRDNTSQPWHGVIVEHANLGDGHRYLTVYLHMGAQGQPANSYINPDILANATPYSDTLMSVSMTVGAGYKLGYQGDAGHADAVHLHFQIQVDPAGYSWPDASPYAVDPRDGYLRAVSSGATSFTQNCVGSATTPDKPSSLYTSNATTSSLQFNWSSGGGNTNGFWIYRWNGSGWSYLTSASSSSRSYTNSGLSSGTTYYYTLCGYNSAYATCADGYATGTTQSVASYPDKPSSLYTSNATTSSLQFNWSSGGGNTNGFWIYRWNGSGWSYLTSASSSSRSYTNSGLSSGTTCYYTLCGYNSAYATCADGYATGTTQSVASYPDKPSSLYTSNATTSSLQFNWSSGGGNTNGFWIYRWNGSGWSYLTSASSSSRSYTNSGLSSGTTYYYTLCGYNSAYATCADGYATGTTQSVASYPDKPSSLYTSNATTSSLQFNWSSGGGNTNGFWIYRWNGSSWVSIATVGSSSRSYTNSGLSSGTTYYYTLCGYNSAYATCADGYATGTTSSSGYGDVIVDDQSSGFVRNSNDNPMGLYWHEYSSGYNNHYWYTLTNQSGVDDRAMWTPNLPAAGNWEVYVYIPTPYATTTNARYRVDHNGSQTVVSVNQNNISNNWVSLGTYYFLSGGGWPNGEVFLGDETYESSTHYIAFDAVKWVWRGS